MDESSKLIRITEAELDIVKKSVWFADEEPIVAIKAEYELKKKKKSKGIAVLTRGALYLFKAKISKKREPVNVFSPLTITRVWYEPGPSGSDSSLSFFFDDVRLVLRSEYVGNLLETLMLFFREAMFGVKRPEQFVVEGDTRRLALSEVTERPKFALKHRAFMIAHDPSLSLKAPLAKYPKASPFAYFDKYEAKRGSKIVLGPSCDPGPYVIPFAQAIAWESRLTYVSFQTVCRNELSDFVNVLLTHSQTISKISFMRYNEKKPLKLTLKLVRSTEVKEWEFYDCSKTCICDFLREFDNLPVGSVESIAIGKASLSENDTKELCAIIESKPTLKVMKSLTLRQMMDGPPLKFFNVRKFMGVFDNLEQVCLAHLEGDSSRLLTDLCELKSICSITLSQGFFQTPLPLDLVIPKRLGLLAFTQASLSEHALFSLIKWITSTPVDVPIILVLDSIFPEKVARILSSLSVLDRAKCYPNLAEFSFNGNYILESAIPDLFAFLYTQKRLRLVSFNACRSDNQEVFLKHLIQLAVSLPLYGLDIMKLAFDHGLMLQWIKALARTTTRFRRLGFQGLRLEDEGVRAFIELISANRELIEVGADGFAPKSGAVLTQLWTAIRRHPSIVANDFPSTDMQQLRIGKDDALWSELEMRPSLSVCAMRERYVSMEVSAGRKPDFSPSIFGATAKLQKEMDVEQRADVFETERHERPPASEVEE